MKKLCYTIALILSSNCLAASQQTVHSSDVDTTWILLCAFLVFVMQAGFMCIEAGMARAKHSINVAVKNLTDFLITAPLFWVAGFGIMFGKTFYGIIGISHFCINDITDNWLSAFLFFQLVFAGTSSTIVSGAVAERIQFTGYIISTFITSLIIYPVFGHWTWGGAVTGNKGWLESFGFVDFAGSTVVHSIGGWIALAGIIILGPRYDKFTAENTPKKIFPYNLRLVYLGVFLMFFGWFGFNGGSTLRVSSNNGIIILNTTLSGCFGGLTALFISKLKNPFNYFEAEHLANGVLGGLVAITAGAHCIETIYVPVIGTIAGIIVYYGSGIIEHSLRLDDVVGAVPVHSFCGVWGTIATGIFMKYDYLVQLGNTREEQILIQLLGVLAAFVWSFGISLGYFYILKFYNVLRVPIEHEYKGLNVTEHGAYTSILELAQEIKNALSKPLEVDSIHFSCEDGSEASEIASYFNTLYNKLNTHYKNEKDLLLQQREKISYAFDKFVHPFVKDEIVKSNIELGGKKCEATILFSDIRNFTQLTTVLGAEKTVEFLNIYFSQMTSIIKEEGGFVDKYIGDAIMAIFGIPCCEANHADKAIHAAFRMIRNLEEFNEHIQSFGIAPIHHGIGICSGTVIAGIIGSQEKMEYTVVGEAVNIASRMENLTKKLKVDLVISSTTFELLSEMNKSKFVKYGKVKLGSEGKPFSIYIRNTV